MKLPKGNRHEEDKCKQETFPGDYGLTQTLAGTKTVYVRVLDKDGNIAMPTAAYKVTVTLPEGFAVLDA